MADEKLLRIYLNDHLAAATVAPRLARRCLSLNRDGELGRLLERLAGELDDDAAEALVASADFAATRSRSGAGVVGERLGLLKLNGRIVNYSPLSRVLELEGLGLLVAFNGSLWRTLGNEHRTGQQAPTKSDGTRKVSPRRRSAPHLGMDE